MQKLVTIVVLFLVLLLAGILLGAFITQWVWAWVVPDVFAGAVQQDILPANLKYWQAVKLDILLALLLAGAGWANSKSSK